MQKEGYQYSSVKILHKTKAEKVNKLQRTKTGAIWFEIKPVETGIEYYLVFFTKPYFYKTHRHEKNLPYLEKHVDIKQEMVTFYVKNHYQDQ